MTMRALPASIILVAALILAAGFHRVRAQSIFPQPQELRFQLVANEPIAGLDGRSVVAGWSVLVFKDRRGGQCFVAFNQADQISAVPISCPQ